MTTLLDLSLSTLQRCKSRELARKPPPSIRRTMNVVNNKYSIEAAGSNELTTYQHAGCFTSIVLNIETRDLLFKIVNNPLPPPFCKTREVTLTHRPTFFSFFRSFFLLSDFNCYMHSWWGCFKFQSHRVQSEVIDVTWRTILCSVRENNIRLSDQVFLLTSRISTCIIFKIVPKKYWDIRVFSKSR